MLAPLSSSRAASSIIDAVVAALAGTLILFSLAAVSFTLHFHLRASLRTGPRPRRRLRDLNSLWAVRVLLAAFACLWSLAELLRLPFLRRSLVLSVPTSVFPRLQVDLCHLCVLASQGFAEPCFFSTLLFLLRASVQGKTSYRKAFPTALALAFLTCLPFFLLYVLFLYFSPWVLRRLSIPPEVFFGRGTATFADGARCTNPLFTTALLAGFGAVYVPWFVSVCGRAVAVVINKRLQVRLYALTSTVVVGISAQVAALALSAFLNPRDAVFQLLSLVAFLGVFFSAVVGEGMLVLRPVADALDVVCSNAPVAADDDRCEVDGAGDGHAMV